MTAKARNPDGTFKLGNKAGSGTKKRLPKTILRQTISEKDLGQLLQNGLQKALNGDDTWAQFLLNKMIPGVKSVSPPLRVALDFTSLETTLRSILERTAEGAIAVDQAKDLIAAAQGVAAVTQLAEFEERLKLLEANRGRLTTV
tara:strand:- start:27 stop:458 length:432 start_codon:yes stop_codon:yes gene_type:complete